MRKKVKSLLALFLVSSVCLGCFGAGTVAFARASYYIDYWNTFTTNYDVNNQYHRGKIYVSYDIDGTGTMDLIGCSLIILQQYNSTTKEWVGVQTYLGTVENGLLVQNTWYRTGTKEFSVTPGKSYRAQVTLYAGKDGGGDSRVKITNSVVAPS